MSASASLQVSFEVFPASNDIGMASLQRCIGDVLRFKPRFVSVTHGANGADKGKTLRSLETLKAQHSALPVAGHLTCAGASEAETLAQARAYEAAGARWVVALRGDSDAGAGGAVSQHLQGFQSAADLVTGLRRETRMQIAVAGYPEPHPESRGEKADFDHLKRKVDAGADAIITQFFFDNNDFYRYVENCRAEAIDVPIIPGIMPIRDISKIARFAARCGATVPARLLERFAKAEARGAGHELALAVCAGQCDELRDQGVRSFHFYTLNDARLSIGTCQALGLDPIAPVEGDGISVVGNELEAVCA